MIKKETYDCVCIGAGPAGSTAAALVAEQGWNTLLVERERMPRFHVGESLMPETYWTLHRLGVIDRLNQSAFAKKQGVQFVTQGGKETRPFLFAEHDDRESAQTWHVERADFDQLLFENAREKGAECVDGTRVVDLSFSANGPHLLTLKDDSGQRQIQCRVIADATGQHALIANRLGLRETYEDLRKTAIWGYFRGGQRTADGQPELTTILHTQDKLSWFWYIPMSNDLVSVGLVSDHERINRQRGTAEEIYAEELDKCPVIQQRLSAAAREGELRVAKEFSYQTKQHAGDGWVLIGDAYGFIDPIYSSGVFLALRSGELAADAINGGLKSGDVSAARLSSWCEDYEKGVDRIRRLVRAFYTNEFSFGEFMKQHPGHQGNLTDLLIGRVFDDDSGKIFEDMDPWLQRLQASMS